MCTHTTATSAKLTISLSVFYLSSGQNYTFEGDFVREFVSLVPVRENAAKPFLFNRGVLVHLALYRNSYNDTRKTGKAGTSWLKRQSKSWTFKTSALLVDYLTNYAPDHLPLLPRRLAAWTRPRPSAQAAAATAYVRAAG